MLSIRRRIPTGTRPDAMSVAAADEPEPTIADLIKALRSFEEQMLAGFAELRRLLKAPLHPEKLPDGLDTAGPLRPFLCDEEDGK